MVVAFVDSILRLKEITMTHYPPRMHLSAITVFLFALIGIEHAGAQTWTQLAPTGGPPVGRYESAGIFDPATNQMIIFGGVASGVGDFNDVWSLSLGASPQWTLLSPAGSAPPPRVGSSAVYDIANSRMIVFGGGLGNTSPCANDVWVLSNANGVGGTPTWSAVSPSGPAPPVRVVHSAVYDEVSNRMIIFGGDNCFSTFYNDLWVLSNANGLGGTPAWTQLSPSGTPPSARAYHTAVYNPGSNSMTVFAGEVPSVGCAISDIWVLSNANGLGGTPTWTQLNPAGPSIPPRCYHSAVYDVASNRMTVFSGFSSVTGNHSNDTWVLTNANGLGGTPTWSQLNPSGSLPAGREGFPAVYNPASDQMTIFGGLADVSGGGNAFVNDVWVLSSANGILHNTCLLYDSTKAVKSGSTIPIKLQLCDSSGNDLSSSTITLHAVSITQSSTSISGDVQDSGNSNPDDDFRFDSTLGSTGGYIFNLKTNGLTTGTYALNFTVTGDSYVYAAPLQVK
jgi:Galactose oxidase, central domain